ncbi:ribonuclease Y [Streptomyces sp. CB01881]|uniref:ribonuclease Y n=1 Tax=Streptomyces sp. CB01881 TaxID=2078691 RepID=UPI000CDCA812|nr:ribonuclease Y [Streptomyces sp. CB01881]AUY49630.1 ribonuclease Y [Streptomyces sp. CB01881]TYC73023.1 ribonuclease Y [Streptomyces sp. CB01881]
MRIALSTATVASLLSAVVLVAVVVSSWLMARRLQGAQRRAAAETERARRWAEEQAGQLRAELDRREQRLTEELRRLAAREGELAERAAALEQAGRDAAELVRRRSTALEQAAGLSADQARAQLVREAEAQARREAAVTVREIERAAKEEGEERARGIVAGAVQRLAAEQTAETAVSVFRLPNEEMKGRIIGREGRNIRAFEAVTGVNLIIDDTPAAVQLSCFDPVRRETARLTLEQLVEDGRIHPLRIEHIYERSREEVALRCVRAGEDALLAVKVGAMHPELVRTLGTLRYRASYGQNVLGHLVESAHLGGMMAAELGVDPEPVRRAALLHDIGKAMTHEAEGSHAAVGAEFARRHGEPADVVHAIAAHHGEVEPRTVEAVLTQAADACSAGRPGARKESLEVYVRRLERLEEIARAHDGVAKVYAMQAGREVRVMVRPEEVDDLGAQVIAREVAKQVAQELTYPGQIRVTVVRESRVTEVAR